MPRVSYVSKDDLSPDDLKHYESIARGRDGVPGLFQMMLHSPDLAARVSRVGEFTRTNESIDAAIREVCVLTIARDLNSQLEWTAHDAQARNAGLRDDVIEAIKNRSTAGLSDDERLYVEYTRKVMANQVDDATFRLVEGRLGPKGIVELTLTIGFTTLMCQFMDTFQAELGPDRTPLLPVP